MVSIGAGVVKHKHGSDVDGGATLTLNEPLKITKQDVSQLYLMRDVNYGASILAHNVIGDILLIRNGYFDGVSFMRFNTGSPIFVEKLIDGFELWRASSGSNPALLSKIFEIKNNGRIIIPDMGCVIGAVNGTPSSYFAGSGWVGYEPYTLIGARSYSTLYLPRNGELVRFYVNVLTNNLNANATVRVNLNGSSAISITIPSGTTGLFSEVSTVASVSAGQFLFFEVGSAASSGSMSFNSMAVTFR